MLYKFHQVIGEGDGQGRLLRLVDLRRERQPTNTLRCLGVRHQQDHETPRPVPEIPK